MQMGSVNKVGHSKEEQCKQNQLKDAAIYEAVSGLSFQKGAAAAHTGS